MQQKTHRRANNKLKKKKLFCDLYDRPNTKKKEDDDNDLV